MAAAARLLHRPPSLLGSPRLSSPPLQLQRRSVKLRRSFELFPSPQLVAGYSQVRWRALSRLITRCDLNSGRKEAATSHNAGTNSGSTETLPPWTALKIGLLAAVPLVVGAFFGTAIAAAAEHSIGKSSLGLKVASFLRGSGWCDEAIVAFVASLPVVELRGAIPVGYWMQLPPLKTYVLAVAGNMLPVPLVALYLERLLNYVASRSEGGRKLVDMILKNTRQKAVPIQEFQWLGLMLFVAVPFPGTGAWTGAFAASILGMTFWEAVSANLVGVLLAGLLVNLVVSVGPREAVFVGIALFVLSTFMWRILRFLNPKKVPEAER